MFILVWNRTVNMNSLLEVPNPSKRRVPHRSISSVGGLKNEKVVETQFLYIIETCKQESKFAE